MVKQFLINDLVLGATKTQKIHWIYNKRKTEKYSKWLSYKSIF
jgi:hypothetical protein